MRSWVGWSVSNYDAAAVVNTDIEEIER